MGCDDMKVCGASLEGRTRHDGLVIEIVPRRQPPNTLIPVVVRERCARKAIRESGVAEELSTREGVCSGATWSADHTVGLFLSISRVKRLRCKSGGRSRGSPYCR